DGGSGRRMQVQGGLGLTHRPGLDGKGWGGDHGQWRGTIMGANVPARTIHGPGAAGGSNPDESWLRIAQWTRRLAWASLAWMTMEGAVGLAAGVSAGAIALVGGALSSAVGGLASVIVICRFRGGRPLSAPAGEGALAG